MLKLATRAEVPSGRAEGEPAVALGAGVHAVAMTARLYTSAGKFEPTWDGTDLWIGEIGETGDIWNPRHIAGGTAESIFQPEWSSDGRLHFISDRTGWWNP